MQFWFRSSGARYESGLLAAESFPHRCDVYRKNTLPWMGSFSFLSALEKVPRLFFQWGQFPADSSQISTSRSPCCFGYHNFNSPRALQSVSNYCAGRKSHAINWSKVLSFMFDGEAHWHYCVEDLEDLDRSCDKYWSCPTSKFGFSLQFSILKRSILKDGAAGTRSCTSWAIGSSNAWKGCCTQRGGCIQCGVK